MARSYQQLIKEADDLRARAEVLRKKETDGVIAKIRVAIAHYGLTATDLGLVADATNPVKAAKKVRGKTSKPAVPNGQARPKYLDGNGRSWSGMGPRPAWIKAALAAGKALEAFKTESTDATTSPPTQTNPKAKPKVKLPAKYRDAAGNEWSGRGSTPLWIRAAVAEGTSLEQLAV